MREKDLSEAEYLALAGRVLEVCRESGTPVILHSYLEAAKELGCERIHLPLWILGRRRKT